jgi:hypothetical protein
LCAASCASSPKKVAFQEKIIGAIKQDNSIYESENPSLKKTLEGYDYYISKDIFLVKSDLFVEGGPSKKDADKVVVISEDDIIFISNRAKGKYRSSFEAGTTESLSFSIYFRNNQQEALNFVKSNNNDDKFYLKYNSDDLQSKKTMYFGETDNEWIVFDEKEFSQWFADNSGHLPLLMAYRIKQDIDGAEREKSNPDIAKAANEEGPPYLMVRRISISKGAYDRIK